MGKIETTTFRSGDSVVVDLPQELGIPADVRVLLERDGETLHVTPVLGIEKERRRTREMLDRIDAIWEKAGGPPATPMVRDPDIFPDRPGLY